jgi:hypothetical protein
MKNSTSEPRTRHSDEHLDACIQIAEAEIKPRIERLLKKRLLDFCIESRTSHEAKVLETIMMMTQEKVMPDITLVTDYVKENTE